MPVAPWPAAVLNATSPGPACMQSYVDPLDPVGDMSEDCLLLNVYTPPSTAAGPWQVLVWIHGAALGPHARKRAGFVYV